MRTRIFLMCAATLATTLVVPAPALAQETFVASPYKPVEHPPDDLPRLDERTAYTIGARRLKLGILAFDYGLTERISIGTDPTPWLVRAFRPVLIPNLHLKVLAFERGPLAIGVKGGAYYAFLGGESEQGHLVTVPLSLFPSVRLATRVWLHLEATYVFARLLGTGNTDNADLNGAVATRTAQAGAMLELRLTRILSIVAVGRYQFYAGPLVFGASSVLDPSTTVRVDGELRPRVERPWEAVAGIAVLWPHVHLGLGAGYGYYFIPGMDIAVPQLRFIPDASLAIVL
jgi:hypothetical protein